mgnify:FL=1
MSSSPHKTVLVTGGHGFVGTNLKKVEPGWIYLSSQDHDLRDPEECRQVVELHRPDAVVHLASKVGGILYNIQNSTEILHDNLLINTNILEACRISGVTRVLACLSTCAWPDHAEEYPMTEEDLLSGPPQETNLSYSYSKRLLYIQCKAYREQYGLNYSCFAPANIYGPYMDCGSNSHFIGALIDKIENSEDTIHLMGTGSPLRQQIYVTDLANLIPRLLEHHQSDLPLVVAPDHNYSIKRLAEMAILESGKELSIAWSGDLNGQHRKDCSPAHLKILLSAHGGVHFTPFDKGIRKTIEWYREFITTHA